MQRSSASTESDQKEERGEDGLEAVYSQERLQVYCFTTKLAVKVEQSREMVALATWRALVETESQSWSCYPQGALRRVK